MKKIFLGLLLMLASPNLLAAVYKCVKGNKVSFSQKPCDGVAADKAQYEMKEINVIENKVLRQSKNC